MPTSPRALSPNAVSPGAATQDRWPSNRGSGAGHSVQRLMWNGPHSPHQGNAASHAIHVEASKDSGEPLDDVTAQGRLESLLFLAKTPLSNRRLAQLAGLEDATRARTLVRQLNDNFAGLGRGVRIESVAGGHRLMTHPSVAPWLMRLGHLPIPTRLSQPMLETLSVVAYRQDVTRADIEAIRGVACGEILRQLMQADLVRIAGRSEDLGRPYLYGTTQRFLKICGLASINALPPIDERVLDDDLAPFEPHPPNPPQPPVPSESTEMTPNSGSGHSPTSSKESDVSVVVTEPGLDDVSNAIAYESVTNDASNISAQSNTAVAVIEDEEDDLYENGLETDYDDEEDDWDDDFDDEEDDDEAEDGDEASEDGEDDDLDDEEDDDEGEDDWQEVDSDEADEEWDEDDESDDDWEDEDDDDEDWGEED